MHSLKNGMIIVVDLLWRLRQPAICDMRVQYLERLTVLNRLSKMDKLNLLGYTVFTGLNVELRRIRSD